MGYTEIAKNLFKWSRTYSGFWKIYLSKLDLIKEPFLIAERSSGKQFYVRNCDKGILKEFFQDSEYSMIDFDEFNSFVDVGAHIGVFSVFVGEKNVNVFSYELDPETFSILERNIKFHELDNIKTYNRGLSGSSGKKNIFRKDNSLGTSVEIKDGKPSDTVEIYSFEGEMEEIADDLREPILLKLDC